jgi:hypothetical protein
MGRLVLTGTLLVTVLGVAHAGPTRKVQVESDPPGATVYLNDVDSGPVCESTPCTISAPLGVSTIILRLDNFEPEISELDVPKGKRPLQQRFKLKSATGILAIEGPRGAVIRVDEVDRGRAPLRLEVTAEAHHVVLVMNGKTVYDDYVEIATGDEVPVRPKTASVENDTPTITDDEDEGGGGGGGNNSSSEITGSAEREPRLSIVSAGVAFDIGFRHFEYSGAMTSNLREEVEGGQVLGGPAIELWPGRLFGVSPLRGLSLFARLQFPISGQQVEGGDLMGVVTTKWSSYEASLRQRWMFGSFGVEVSTGFVQDQFTFDTTVGTDLALMPDTQYQSLRIGGKLAYVLDSIEPYITAENRIVMSGGPVGDRFATSNTSGIRGSAGLAMRLGSFFVRAEGTLKRYSWTFSYQPGDMSRAEGASDSIQLISMGVGYSY